MLKVNLKSIGYYCLLLSIICLTSCENDTVFSNENSNEVSATFVKSIASASIAKSTTNNVLSGTWKSFSDGTQSKWVFKNNILLKNNIYSFGEINAPQKYTFQTMDGFDGNQSKYGLYITLLSDDSKSKGSQYKIVVHNANKITLESKFKHTIVLTKE